MKTISSIVKKVVLCSLVMGLGAFLASVSTPEMAGGLESKALAASSYQFPILCYHAVVNQTNSTYQTSLASFKEQIAYLKNNGYTTLSMSQFQNIINGQATAPSKAILLTFDDCSSDFYSVVYPLLKSYGMKATQFAVTNWIGGSGRLTKSQLSEMSRNNIDVQNHTDAHTDMTKQTYAQQYSAIKNGASVIQGITGKSVTALAYPYGAYNNNSLTALANAGHTMAFTTSYGLCTNSNAKLKLPRICMVNTDNMNTFKSKITKGY